MALKTSLIIDLAGNIQARARQYGSALGGLARKGRAAMQGLRSAAVNLGRAMDGMAGKYTAAIAGAGLAYKGLQALKTSASLDKQLARVAYTADMSRAQTEELRAALYAMARDTGQPVEDLLEGFNGLVQSGQSFGEALATIKAINPAMAVTGASASVLASGMTVAAQAFKFDLSNPEVARRVLDQMVVAGKLGNAELEDLSAIFARVGNNARSAGLGFEATLAFLERLSLVEKAPERLATLADSTLRLANNQKYMEKAAKVTGVKFYDAKGERRDLFDVFAEIRDKWRTFKTSAERDRAFAQAFGETDLDTQRGLKIFFDASSIEEAREFTREIKEANGAVAQGLAAAVDNSVDQVERLKSALGKAADEFARPINETISGAIKGLLDTYQLGGKEILVGGGVAALAGVGALKLAGKGLSGMAGKVASGMAKSAGLAGLKLPLPVYVVNRQMSLTRDAMLGKEGGAVPPVTTGGGKSAKKGKSNTGAKAAGAGAVIVDTALTLVPKLTDDKATFGDKAGAVVEAAGSLAGGWAGTLAGAKAGAFVGAFAGPFGAAAGGVIGGAVGGFVGSELGQTLVNGAKNLFSGVADWFTGKPSTEEAVTRAAQQMREAAALFQQTCARGVGVDVNVQGNATASIARGSGEVNLSAGVSHSRMLGG